MVVIIALANESSPTASQLRLLGGVCVWDGCLANTKLVNVHILNFTGTHFSTHRKTFVFHFNTAVSGVRGKSDNNSVKVH